MRRFLERTQDDRIADLRRALDARMRTNPTVADNIRVAHHGSLAHHAERQRRLFAEQPQLLVERGLDVGFALVEKLHVHEVRGNVREHAHLARTHLVAHRDGRTDHVVNLAAAHQRAHVLHHRAVAYQHVAEHAHLVHQRILDNAVVHQAVVDARRERDIARQQESAVESGQADIAHEDGIAYTAGREIRIDQDAAPVLTTVAVLLQSRDLLCRKGAELSAVGLRRLQSFGKRRQNAVLQHFFQFEQTLHIQKID